MDDSKVSKRRSQRALPPGRFTSRSLSFDVATDTLLLFAHEGPCQLHQTELYLRKTSEERYTNVCELVGPLVERADGEDLLVTTWAHGAGRIYFVAATVPSSASTATSDPAVRPVVPRCLVKIDLSDRDTTIWPLPLESLIIAELLGAEGDRIYATVTDRTPAAG